jgi:hypothetical protein
VGFLRCRQLRLLGKGTGLPGRLDLGAAAATALLVAAALRKVPVAWPQWAKAVPAYGIGTMAAFWFLQRAVS